MSIWYEMDDEDIEIDHEAREINFHVGHDEMGNNYVTLTFEQIRDLFNQIECNID